MSEASSSYEEIIAEPTDNATHTPNSNSATEAVETQLQELLQSLLDLSIIVYDFQPDGNRLVWNKINDIITHYQNIDRLKDDISEYIPEEVINYVEQGRNPDIFTRSFIERAAGENQYTNGKIQAVSEFRDLLKSELSQSFPDLDIPDFPASSLNNDKLGGSAIDNMIESSTRLATSEADYSMDINAIDDSIEISQSDALNGIAKDYDGSDDNSRMEEVDILSLDWYIRRDIWRQKALDIRQQFELNKHVTSPKELEQIFAKTEKQLEEFAHPDPYTLPMGPEGTKWERNIPPRMFDH
ncbi:unnamed protein product [Umbelopsis vinacea]